MDTSAMESNIFFNHPEQSVDWNYRGIRIKVFKNGDQYDTGTVVVICRKRFKHWLTFLDFLTKKLDLMAPVHEFYRTDGLRIRHFEEIENGESYVAVSQGPFLRRPYGMLPEDREKWNIDPKFESSEQSTLDSAESVDIYLKQRGYTSRTGLPFPFDGGVCANHSLIEHGRSRAPSTNPPNSTIHQHRNKMKSEENNSKNGELLEEYDRKLESPREDGEKFDPQSASYTNSDVTISHAEPTNSIPEPESKASVCGSGTGTTNENDEQNDEILQSSIVAQGSENKVEGNDSGSETVIQNDRKRNVDEYVGYMQAPVIQIPDSSRESPVTQDAKTIESLAMMQGTNSNYYPSLPTGNPETVITIVNDDAMINAGNNSIIIVNISTSKQRSANTNNVQNSGNESTNTSLLINKFKGAEVSSQSAGVRMAVFSDGNRTVNRMPDTTETNIAMAVHIGSTPSAATTDRLSLMSVNTEDQRTLPKKSADENDEGNAKNSKINSNERCDNLSMGKNAKRNENNLTNKCERSPRIISKQNSAVNLQVNAEQKTNFTVEQNDKQVRDVSPKNNAKLNEASRNSLNDSTSSVQRNECKSVNAGSNKEGDRTDNNQSSHISVASEQKCRMEDEKQMNGAKSNPGKAQEFLTTDKNSQNRKRVTLVTPTNVDTNLEMQSGKDDIVSNSTGQLKSPKRTAADISSANISATTTTSAVTTTNNSTGDNTSKDVSMHTTNREEKESSNLQQKYHSEGETSFEADFTPRDDRTQRSSSRMKTQKVKIGLDLNVDISRLVAQKSYDPDFKDYDFIQ
uniref:Doublecortin domain-containing protein n=1 Tax=Elaeophora elaphi TaxID=1147741 RepID=A0A0R3RUB6_9BILA